MQNQIIRVINFKQNLNLSPRNEQITFVINVGGNAKSNSGANAIPVQTHQAPHHPPPNQHQPRGADGELKYRNDQNVLNAEP